MGQTDRRTDRMKTIYTPLRGCIKRILEKILQKSLPAINLYVDNKSLHDAAKTSNSLADRRLMIDMSAIRQMIERKERHSVDKH